MFRSKDITNIEVVDEYLLNISKNHCPFISPSVENKVMNFSIYSISNCSFDDIQKFIFYTGLIHTYAFRSDRSKQLKHKESLLFCENIIYNIDKEVNGESLFSYPHWFLKLLFTEKSILFGKFWKGEAAKNKNDVEILIPPIHLLSIRSAIKPIDSRFFAFTPELNEFYINSEDDKQGVLNFINKQSLKKIIQEMEDLNYNYKNKDGFHRIINKMMDSELYLEIANWASGLEQELGIKNYSSSLTNK